MDLFESVQQEQHRDLLSFLRELNSDAIPPEQIHALIQHANVDKKKPDKLHIFAKSNGFESNPSDLNFRVLNATIRIDFPSVVEALAFISTDPPESGSKSTEEIVLFEENDLKREMSLRIYLHANNIMKVYTDEETQSWNKVAQKSLNDRLRVEKLEDYKHYGCYIAVRLKPFMSWNHQYRMATIKGRQFAILRWLDIEVKKGSIEELLMEIVRKDQRINSESPFGALDGPFAPFPSQRGQAPVINVEDLEPFSNSTEFLFPKIRPKSSSRSMRRWFSHGRHHSDKWGQESFWHRLSRCDEISFMIRIVNVCDWSMDMKESGLKLK